MRFVFSLIEILQRRLSAHFQHYRTYDPWTFSWRIALEYLGVSFAVLLLVLRLPLPRTTGFVDRSGLLTYALVGAPVIETILFQVIPIGIAIRLKASFASQVIWSMALFALAHFAGGIDHGLVAGLVGGFYFAFTYARWREISPWTAFWTTALSQAAVNTVVFWEMIALRRL